MKKILSPFLLVCLLFCVLAGCGTAAEPDALAKSVDLADAMDTIRGSVELPEMMDLTDDNLLDYFGIESAWFTESAACINASGYEKDEILLLRAADAESVSLLQAQLEQSLENAAEEMRNYLPEQYAMIQNSRVETKGLYVWVFISDKNDQIRAIWNEMIE